MHQRLSRFKKSAALALAVLFCLFANALNAQWTTPTINGTIGASEYGVHTDGENQQNNGGPTGQTWYVTWNNDSLYFGITNANLAEGAVIYIDTNPLVPINGGTNTNGTIVGFNYDGTNFAELPFRADIVLYVKNTYREYRTTNGSGGWSGSTTSFGSYADGASNTREFSLPWSAVGGRPASFAWFGYVTSGLGFVFGQVPVENAGGNIGTSARYSRYYIVNNTGNGTSTKPFARNSYVFNSTTDITGFGAITVYDFTMNTASRSITRASDGSSWTINGALRIYQGTVNFGSNTGSCTVNDSIAIASGGTLTLSNNADALTANGNFRIDGTFNANNSTVRFAGNNNTQAVSGSASSVTFYNIVVSKQDSRTELVLPTTLSYNNPLHFGHTNMTINNFTLDSGLVYLSPVTGSGTFTRTISGNVTIGSTPSSIIGNGLPATPIRANTVLIINNLGGATVNTTVNGNIQEGTSGSGYVTLILAGKDCNSSSSSSLTVNGNVSFSSRPVSWNGNGTTPPTSVGSMTFNFGGNISITNTLSIFNGNRAGTGPAPTINLTGSNKTVDILPVVFLGGGPTTGGTNAQANWVIPSTASITIPSTGALAINMGRTLTVDGTLICADGAQLIGTATGPSSGNPTFALGSSGTLRVADVDGLGDGTLIGSPNDSATPPNATLFFRQKAPAQPLQQTNPVPTSWNLSSINSNGTIEYNGTGQTVTPRNGSNNYYNLVFSGGDKTLGGDVDVTNSLVLNGGIITTGTNDLRLTNTSPTSLTRTSGHINGRLVRAIGTLTADYFYPIGDASTYRQITLACSSYTSASPLRGEVISGNANSFSVSSPLQSVSFLRYYQFTNTGANTIEVNELKNVQVSGDDGIGSLNPNNSLRLSSRISGSWAERTLTAAPNTTSLPIQISSTFFIETVASGGNYFVSLATTSLGDNPLPVELLSFTATSTAQGVKLAWETASEHESRGFTLLRRKQGETDWAEVASYQTDNALRSLNALNGASYSFTDKALLEVGKSYDYQLRETGFDGQVATLETVTLTVRFNVARAFELAQNYPNPFNPTTTIRYQIPTAETVSLKVYDVLGKEVATLVNRRQEAGSYVVPFNASGLSSGMYFYRLQAGGFVETKKMMLVK